MLYILIIAELRSDLDKMKKYKSILDISLYLI